MSSPSSGSGDDKDGSEERSRNSALVIRRGTVEIQVGVHLLFVQHYLLHGLGNGEQLRFSSRSLRESFGITFNDRTSGITVLVDTMTEAHELLLVGESFVDNFSRMTGGVQRGQEGHSSFISTSM